LEKFKKILNFKFKFKFIAFVNSKFKFKFIVFKNPKFKFIVFENPKFKFKFIVLENSKFKFKFIVFENLKFKFIVFKTSKSIILKFETICIVLKHESSNSVLLLCVFNLNILMAKKVKNRDIFYIEVNLTYILVYRAQINLS